jgi:hypothetical protein
MAVRIQIDTKVLKKLLELSSKEVYIKDSWLMNSSLHTHILMKVFYKSTLHIPGQCGATSP